MYDRGLPEVYGYLVHRCGDPTLAEDLTAETFLAAVRTFERQPSTELSVGWLITVSRNKLVDHWRRLAQQSRNLRAVEEEAVSEAATAADPEDGWIAAMTPGLAGEVLAELAPHHRAALTLRYVDDLPVADVATALDRTLHATEALLVRARRAFRTIYETRADADTRGGDHD